MVWYDLAVKLHRVGRSADWDKLKSRQRNFWQRLAVSTHGIITPGNAISVIGFIMVLWGLGSLYNKYMVSGIVAITIGRILDIADGILADKTGTKSPLGETVDATIDKIEIVAALPVLVITSTLMPWQAIVMFLQHLANSLFALITKMRGRLPHASRTGKYATTAQWAAIVLYASAQLNSSLRGVGIFADVVFGVSIVLGVFAAWMYANKALKSD